MSRFLWCLFWGVCGVALTMANGRAADEVIELPDLVNGLHAPLKVAADRGAAMVFFVSPYCPTSNKLMPEINQIVKDYEGRVAAWLVHADAGVKREDVQQHLAMFEVKATVLLDVQQVLMRRLQAGITPEVVLISKTGEVVYQGRINDLYLTSTKRQRQATVHDLRRAIDEVLGGKPVTVARTEAVGCKIAVKP